MCKVSVIVPIYNAERYINKCIKSILGQTFTDFELILVNDGSTDKSLNLCLAFKGQDHRITVIDKQNEGSVRTRNKGLAAARSDYVLFVDVDDWIAVDMIEVLYNHAIRDHADITVCNRYKVLGRNSLIKRSGKSKYFDEPKLYTGGEVRTELVTAYLFGHPFPSALSAKLYKRELFANTGKYVERIHFLGDDLFYNIELFLKAERVKIIPTPLYYYRIGGFSSKYMPYLFEDAVNGYEIQKEVIEEYFLDSRDEQYIGISLMLLNTLKTCLKNLFSSNMSELNIKKMIESYVENYNVNECIKNSGSHSYFPDSYLQAIEHKDIEYLFKLGRNEYIKGIPKKYLYDVIGYL
ncbi:glycosyltransferase family 2 protein [Paenibacillus harenae]|uniref:glycosyltransferase family 2 protein n=1 Tax=Paenibacillus harenae TaxID=306543 RepID=UPI0027D80165|nr:glycosyltransferase [Paenibacillus harenae]